MKAANLKSSVAAAFTAFALFAAPVQAHELETVNLAFERPLPNVPGKSLRAYVVTYAPGGKSPSHHHAKSAFIYARVLSGAVRSKVNDEPAKVYRTGESFYEDPGSHHKVSENASNTKPASLLAVFIVDTDETPDTSPDK